jgi:hypothetical protein
MTAKDALLKLRIKGFTLREIAFLLRDRGIDVSYSTLSRIETIDNYTTNNSVAQGLILMARKRA